MIQSLRLKFLFVVCINKIKQTIFNLFRTIFELSVRRSKLSFFFVNFRVTVNMLSLGRDGLRVKNMRNIRDTYLPKYVSRVKFERFHTILAAVRNKNFFLIAENQCS